MDFHHMNCMHNFQIGNGMLLYSHTFTFIYSHEKEFIFSAMIDIRYEEDFFCKKKQTNYKYQEAIRLFINTLLSSPSCPPHHPWNGIPTPWHEMIICNINHTFSAIPIWTSSAANAVIFFPQRETANIHTCAVPFIWHWNPREVEILPFNTIPASQNAAFLRIKKSLRCLNRFETLYQHSCKAPV